MVVRARPRGIVRKNFPVVRKRIFFPLNPPTDIAELKEGKVVGTRGRVVPLNTEQRFV